MSSSQSPATLKAKRLRVSKISNHQLCIGSTRASTQHQTGKQANSIANAQNATFTPPPRVEQGDLKLVRDEAEASGKPVDQKSGVPEVSSKFDDRGEIHADPKSANNNAVVSIR